MKAIILAAGIGSRIRPLTNDRPKFLLPIGDRLLGQIVMDNLLEAGIREFIIITGYFADKVEIFLKSTYPSVPFTFIHNPLYDKTNTAYSLSLAEKAVGPHEFIKLDGDVLFDTEIINKLKIASKPSCLCMDTNIHLDKEEVKVRVDSSLRVLEVGKKINPKLATGESIGIEKVDVKAGAKLFSILRNLLKKQSNHQEYYDDSYTTLVQKGFPFYAIDISNLDWVEIDTLADYKTALKLFT